MSTGPSTTTSAQHSAGSASGGRISAADTGRTDGGIRVGDTVIGEDDVDGDEDDEPTAQSESQDDSQTPENDPSDSENGNSDPAASPATEASAAENPELIAPQGSEGGADPQAEETSPADSASDPKAPGEKDTVADTAGSRIAIYVVLGVAAVGVALALLRKTKKKQGK